MTSKRLLRKNTKKTDGEIFINGTKYKYRDANKENIVEWLRMIQNKYS